MRIIFSIIRIVAGALILIFLVLPIKAEVDSLKFKKSELGNTEAQAKEYSGLGQDVVGRFQSIDPAQVERLKKMVPDTIDNIRFINDVNGIAKKTGMKLKKVDYNAQDLKGEDIKNSEKIANSSNPLYGSYTVSFAVSGTYKQFVEFLEALENSLRLVDITSVTFTSVGQVDGKVESYDFSVKAQSYWLKN
ncbi:MAG: type 4a pilus biogenesis protein PilO [Candidatus Pacebacteria bacterium]|nr:type 4a pilus biogenesis protein PilO [Candidatus Paceibacterota bacterium]